MERTLVGCKSSEVRTFLAELKKNFQQEHVRSWRTISTHLASEWSDQGLDLIADPCKWKWLEGEVSPPPPWSSIQIAVL